AARTPFTDPWNSPGRAALSTSAITAIRIVSAVTPTSLAACPCCGLAPTDVAGIRAPTSPSAATISTHRLPFTATPLVAVRRGGLCPLLRHLSGQGRHPLHAVDVAPSVGEDGVAGDIAAVVRPAAARHPA